MNIHKNLNKKSYIISAMWILLVDFICVTNDVITQQLGTNIHPIQIAFIRFLVTALSVLPFMLPKGTLYFRARMHNLHFWRALLGTFAVGFGIVSLAYFPIASNAGLMFSEPIFFLPLAAIFLREKVGAGRVLCSLLGFAGVVIILHEDMNVLGIACLFPLLSAFLFAVICVIAKKMVYDEHLLTLLFYFGVGTTIFALVPAMFVWKAVSLWQIVMMIILGINGNLVQVCMFKAYAISDAAPLASIRYFELVLANLVGVLILNQALNVSVIIGSIIIVSCTILSTVIERRNNRPARHIRTADPFTLNFAPAKTKYKNLLP